jgi:hypothetical protein
MKETIKLNRYTLHIITGGSETGVYLTYEEAHDYYTDCGGYHFYILDDRNNKTIISIYPIDRTIINKISNI